MRWKLWLAILSSFAIGSVIASRAMPYHSPIIESAHPMSISPADDER